MVGALQILQAFKEGEVSGKSQEIHVLGFVDHTGSCPCGVSGHGRVWLCYSKARLQNRPWPHVKSLLGLSL